MCARASISQDGFQQRSGRLTSLPFDLQGAFLHMYSREGLLDLENEKYVVSVVYLGRAQPLLLSSCYYLHLGVSVHRGQTPAAQLGAHLSPASLGCSFASKE